jgi:ABC-type phosphonate transport system ATPase subunit
MNVLDRLSTMPDTTKSTLPLLRVEGLSHAFGGQQVLQDMAVELRRGEVVIINSNCLSKSKKSNLKIKFS